MLRHDELLARAERLEYPAPLVRLLVALYTAPRHVFFQRAVTLAIRPTRGKVPGCPHAQTLVKVYYIESFDAFCIRHPAVFLDAYSDDLQVLGAGDEAAVIQNTAAAALDLRRVVHTEIKASLAAHKAAVVASSNRIADQIRAFLGNDGGMPVRVTQSLGIDFAAGRAAATAGRTSKQKQRLTMAASKAFRISNLAKAAKRSPKQVVRQGLVKGAPYGASVTGMSDRRLLQLRRTCATTTAPRAAGRSLDLALYFSGSDPGPEATAAPMVRWAKKYGKQTFRGIHGP